MDALHPTLQLFLQQYTYKVVTEIVSPSFNQAELTIHVPERLRTD